MLLFAAAVFALRAPGSLGIGQTSHGRSFALLRACLLYSSLGAMALLARAFKLWDTRTAQGLLRDMVEARALKLGLYLVLLVQLALYLIVALQRIDWAMVVCFIGLNYLGTKAPQMLWSYGLLTVATVPQVCRGGGKEGGGDPIHAQPFRTCHGIVCTAPRRRRMRWSSPRCASRCG